MAIFNGEHQGDELLSEINVTPLVDVMLVLVVIFIVTASAATTAVRVELPRTERVSQSGARHPLLLSVDRQGAYRLDGQPVPLAELEQRLAVIHGKSPGRTAQLEADRNVTYGRVASAMAALEHAGIRKVTILSSPR